MDVHVVVAEGEHRVLRESGADLDLVNAFLTPFVRNFSTALQRAYALVPDLDLLASNGRGPRFTTWLAHD